MSRRELREQIFLMLFRTEFYEKEELLGQLDMYSEDAEIEKTEEDMAYIEGKLRGIVEHMADIDQSINEVSKGWKTSRMSKVDLTIIRLAVYEMKYEDTIPTGVAINEAVELAKNYGSDDSASFVNGILAKLA